jgi:uncharacterized membrane protein
MIKVMLGLITAIALGSTFISRVTHADDSPATKVGDAAGDVKTDVKKGIRTANRNKRKALHNDNVLKDARDKANDAGDDISNGADKVKRHSK